MKGTKITTYNLVVGAPTVRGKQTKYGPRKGMTPKGIINRTKGAS